MNLGFPSPEDNFSKRIVPQFKEEQNTENTESQISMIALAQANSQTQTQQTTASATNKKESSKVMSQDTTNTTEATQTEEKPLVKVTDITRTSLDGTATLPFYATPFQRQSAESEKANLTYPCPTEDDVLNNIDDVLKFVGKKIAANWLFKQFRSTCQAMNEEACEFKTDAEGKPMKDEKGEMLVDFEAFDLQKFVKLVQDWKITTETMSELKDKLEKLYSKQGQVSTDFDNPKYNHNGHFNKDAWKADIMAIKSEIEVTRSQIASKTRVRQPKDKDEMAANLAGAETVNA